MTQLLAPETHKAVLEVNGLTLDLKGSPGQPGLIDDISFAVPAGEAVAIIGESGCGKTMTAMTLLGLQPGSVRPVHGSIRLGGQDLLGLSGRRLAQIRGREIGMIFQEPMNSLNPTMTVGHQIAETRRIHLGESRGVALRRAAELLDRVGIPDAARRVKAYPHELSGGMQQRVMIAAAIACDPRLLIADEPTTALDVTIQDEILQLLRSFQKEDGLAVLLVTHDLGVVADFCDHVVVMYAGKVVERADIWSLMENPRHPYTRALLQTMPGERPPRQTLPVIEGRVPPAGSFPTGCRFAPRCVHALPECVAADAASVEGAVGCLRVARGEVLSESQMEGVR